MRQIRLNVVDAGRACSGTVHAGVADAAVAGLSAEPESIDELEDVMARFRTRIDDVRPFAGFCSGTDYQPVDGGIMVIDLGARVVVAESKCVKPAAAGSVVYPDSKRATKVRLPYRLPEDWLFVDSRDVYQAVRERRMAERAANPPFDARPVLYGAVAQFVVERCLAARDENLDDPVANIHADWLMTPRVDLRSQSPREVMLSKFQLINSDLESRERQWSLLGEPAPCLNEGSTAYRFAAFGIHEVVLYYELVRLLISSCWARLAERRAFLKTEEMARLEQVQRDWLGSPQEELSGKSPAYVLECERKRLPLLVPPDELELDDDCPLCRMMARENRPTFWHLSGCNMDSDYAFSFFATREEWEAHEADFLESLARWEEEEKSGAAGVLTNTRSSTRPGPVVH